MSSFRTAAFRPFLGALNFEESRFFYRTLGYKELVIDAQMSLFTIHADASFYLQDHYVHEWVNNSMVLLEVDDVEACERDLKEKNLPATFKRVMLSDIKDFDWGRELFLHDPAGILWHFCEFC